MFDGGQFAASAEPWESLRYGGCLPDERKRADWNVSLFTGCIPFPIWRSRYGRVEIGTEEDGGVGYYVSRTPSEESGEGNFQEHGREELGRDMSWLDEAPEEIRGEAVAARYSAMRVAAVDQAAREQRTSRAGRAAARHADAGLVSHYVHGGLTRRATMKNITITLPDDLARWLRVRAAEDDRSVSRWIADLLAGMRRGEDEYEVAMKRFLAIKPWKMEWVDGRKPTREELHDRAGLR